MGDKRADGVVVALAVLVVVVAVAVLVLLAVRTYATGAALDGEWALLLLFVFGFVLRRWTGERKDTQETQEPKKDAQDSAQGGES